MDTFSHPGEGQECQKDDIHSVLTPWRGKKHYFKNGIQGISNLGMGRRTPCAILAAARAQQMQGIPASTPQLCSYTKKP
jgi:hypothetical protein